MKKPEWKKIDFRAEVKEYIDSLNRKELEQFEKHYSNLISYGRSLKWIYFALVQLGTRSVLTSGNLFYNKSFCEDVHRLVDSYDIELTKRAHSAFIKEKVDYEYSGILCARMTKFYTQEKAKAFLEEYFDGDSVPNHILIECLRDLPNEEEAEEKRRATLKHYGYAVD